MCGIVGYVGSNLAYPVLIDGLKKLEYRGYDSAGVALHTGNSIEVYKKEGKVSALEGSVYGKNIQATIGIGHTRCATHGETSNRSAHPHSRSSGDIAMTRKVIIENSAELRNELLQKGYTFKSATDSEVLVSFMEDININDECSLEEAVR